MMAIPCTPALSVGESSDSEEARKFYFEVRVNRIRGGILIGKFSLVLSSLLSSRPLSGSLCLRLCACVSVSVPVYLYVSVCVCLCVCGVCVFLSALFRLLHTLSHSVTVYLSVSLSLPSLRLGVHDQRVRHVREISAKASKGVGDYPGPCAVRVCAFAVVRVCACACMRACVYACKCISHFPLILSLPGTWAMDSFSGAVGTCSFTLVHTFTLLLNLAPLFPSSLLAPRSS